MCKDLETGEFECIKCGVTFEGIEALCTHIDICGEDETDEIKEAKKFYELEDESKRAESYLIDRMTK